MTPIPGAIIPAARLPLPRTATAIRVTVMAIRPTATAAATVARWSWAVAGAAAITMVAVGVGAAGVTPVVAATEFTMPAHQGPPRTLRRLRLDLVVRS